MYGYYSAPTYLAHHGIKGQKWGVRRYRNTDGSLTDAGKKRYSNGGKVEQTSKDAKKERVRKFAGKVARTAAIGTAAGAATAYGVGIAKGLSKNRPAKPKAAAAKNPAKDSSSAKKGGDKDRANNISKGGRSIVSGVQEIVNAKKPVGPENPNRYNHRRTLTQEEMDAMSDKDLQQLVNRLNLETNYSRLTQKPAERSKVEIGISYVSGIVGIAAGAATIYSVLKK